MKKCMDNGVEAPKTYKIKLSGDGTKVSRITGFIVLSFSILNYGKSALSSSGKYR